MEEEQRKDNEIMQLKKWLLTRTKPDSTAYLTPGESSYFKQMPRIIIRNGILLRKFYDQTGNNYAIQLIIPKHLRRELILRCHNHRLGGHRGVRLTIELLRRNYYFPQLQEYLRDHIRNCVSCGQMKRVPEGALRMPMRSVLEMQNLPEQTMQVDIVGPLPTAGGKSYIVTAIDLFTRYLFAVPVGSITADVVGRTILGICLRHSYIPQTLMADQGTQFMAKMIKEMTEVLGISIEPATVKHHQTIGALERCHAQLKKFLAIYDVKNDKQWHHLVDFATHAHNTTIIPKLGTCPATLFHGREPITSWEVRFNSKSWNDIEVKYNLPSEIMANMTKLNRANQMTLMDACQNYRGFFNRKARANQLEVLDLVLLLAPDLETQRKLFHKYDPTWVPLVQSGKETHIRKLHCTTTRHTQHTLRQSNQIAPGKTET